MTRVELTWLGQSGFLVSSDTGTVAIDLFLSSLPARVYEPPDPGCVPPDVVAFLVSHLHADHFDGPALDRLASTRPMTVVVPAGAQADAEASVNNPMDIVGISGGQTHRFGEIQVTALAVEHGVQPSDAYAEGDFVGYLMDVSGVRVFHSGDAVVSAKLVRELASHQPDIVLLPINGRSWHRERAGIVGNMNAEEATMLADEVGAQILIPMHYDAILGNTANPGDVALLARSDVASTLHVIIPARAIPLAIDVQPRSGPHAARLGQGNMKDGSNDELVR